jgi:hypothetical protein
MTENEYLEAILLQQTLAPGSPELKELQERGEEVKSLLRSKFGTARIREAGSKRKGTMVKASYDLDLTCYFPHDDNSAGETLKEIFEGIEAALREKYVTSPKGSAIRVWDGTGKTDFHIDVVPGRFVDGNDGDVFLYRSSGDKERLKTNLDVHIDHVRDSGVLDAIRLTKLWRERNGGNVKTFALELLVIKLLEKKKNEALSEQLRHVWEQFKEDGENLTIEDPANPSGNDLSELLNDGIRSWLSSTATNTLDAIEQSGWDAVFGEVESDKSQRVEALRRITVATPIRTKPWGNG